jgi:hypothetical protein
MRFAGSAHPAHHKFFVSIQQTTEKKSERLLEHFATESTEEHGKTKALEVIFPCSSVDSVANGILLWLCLR